MARYPVFTIGATAVVAMAFAVTCHESAHALAGRLAGGAPGFLTATEVTGDYSALSPGGLVALGVSGSLVNVLLCACGWWLLRRGPRTVGWYLFAWFTFAVNGMLVTTAMVGESLAGWGDWMTILGPLPGTAYARPVVAALGLAGLAVMVRRSGAALAAIVRPGTEGRRVRDAVAIVLVGGAAATALLLGASVASPVGSTRALLLGVGAGSGSFVPMLFGVRFVRRHPPGPPLADGSRRPWVLAAAAVTLALWFVIGPGIALS